jgi:D-cysteine desulfhydrase
VEAGLELGAQIAAGECPSPESIYVAAGTLGTVVGMAIGLALAGSSIPIHAVRITSQVVTNQRVLRALVRDTLALLRGAGTRLPASEQVLATIDLRHDQVGEGYGRDTEAAGAAAAAFSAAGLQLDGTYTAKAAAALLAEPVSAQPPLFWHTLSRWQPQTPQEVREDALPDPFRRMLTT